MTVELPDDVADALGNLVEAGFSIFGSEIENVVEFYARYCVGSVESANSLGAQLIAASQELGQRMDTDLNNIDNGVESWSGTAAGGFEEYMGEVRESLHIHIDTLDAMNIVATGYGAMLTWIREQLVTIAQTTADALNGLPSFVSIVFDAVTVVLEFISGVYTLDAAKKLVDWISGALSLSSAARTTVVLGGGSPAAIMSNYQAAIAALAATVEEQIENFRHAIAEIAATLDPGRLPDVRFVQQGSLDIVEANTPFDPGEFVPGNGDPVEGVNVVDDSPLLDSGDPSKPAD